MNYASIEYSKELAWLFPDAEWWWYCYKQYRDTFSVVHEDNDAFVYARSIAKDQPKSTRKKIYEAYPAITTDMALEVLPTVIEIQKNTNGYTARMLNDGHLFCYSSLPNALCALIQHLVKEGVINNEQ